MYLTLPNKISATSPTCGLSLFLAFISLFNAPKTQKKTIWLNNDQNDSTVQIEIKTAMPDTPDSFGEISKIKAIVRKYLKKKCWSKVNEELSFKYYLDLQLITKLFS